MQLFWSHAGLLEKLVLLLLLLFNIQKNANLPQEAGYPKGLGNSGQGAVIDRELWNGEGWS